MKLSSLLFENYKPFKSRDEIALKPLTILLGKNSSGKSALARLPLLFAHALSSTAEAPLDLLFDGLDFGGSFRDLVHNRLPHGNVVVGGELDTQGYGSIKLLARVQYIDELNLQVVSEYTITLPSATLTFTWLQENDELNQFRKYKCMGSIDTEILLDFRGLRPYCENQFEIGRDLPQNIKAILQIFWQIRAASRLFEDRILHIGPLRPAPLRSYRFPGRMPRASTTSTALRAPEILGADYSQKIGILKQVADWYAENLGWSIDVATNQDTFELVLRNKSQATAGVNLVDVGQGMSQVLPVVVLKHFSDTIKHANVLEVIEQPELHLHPAVHGAIADLYVDTVKRGGCSIIETHSEVFCLRIRQRVAAGKLDPSNVIIYWVSDTPDGGSSVIPINILPDGSVTNWPVGVFSEDMVEIRQLRAVQRRDQPQ